MHSLAVIGSFLSTCKGTSSLERTAREASGGGQKRAGVTSQQVADLARTTKDTFPDSLIAPLTSGRETLRFVVALDP